MLICIAWIYAAMLIMCNASSVLKHNHFTLQTPVQNLNTDFPKPGYIWHHSPKFVQPVDKENPLTRVSHLNVTKQKVLMAFGPKAQSKVTRGACQFYGHLCDERDENDN